MLKNKYYDYIIIIFWLLTISSINTIQDNFFEIFIIKDQVNILIYINFIRFIIPTIILTILFIFFIYLKKKLNLFLIYLFLYGLWQLIILLTINRNINEIGNYQLILNLFSVILIIYVGYYFCSETLLRKILYINLIFISFIAIIFSKNLISEFINNVNIYNLYGTESLAPLGQTFMQPNPRITGIARIILIIFYFFFFINKKINNIRFNYPIYLLLYLLVLLIYFFQTRTGLLGILLFVFYYLFIDNTKVNKKIVFLFIIIIMPFISYKLTQIIRKDYNAKLNNNIAIKNLVITERLTEVTSSGRTTIWAASIEQIRKHKIIFGIGPQADRKLLNNYLEQNKKIHNYDNNASNALIYSYLCGGVFSFTLLILTYYKILRLLIETYNNRKELLEKDPLIEFSFLTLILILVRSFFENSFALFSIDLIFILPCYLIIAQKKYYKK
jgi:O-antigen ligase